MPAPKAWCLILTPRPYAFQVYKRVSVIAITVVWRWDLLRGQPHGGPVIEGTRDLLLLRPPLPRQLLGLGYLGRGHPLGNDIAVLDRFIAVLAGGETRSGKV